MPTTGPPDTSNVQLPPELTPLAELLARHNHDVWARRRLRDGWRWGASRDDAARTHPMLVPYEELPNAEKEYDRQTVQETLKAIVSLGFTIAPPPPERGSVERRIDPAAARPTTVPQLIDAWRQLRAVPHPIETYRLVAEGLLNVGEPLLAYDVCRAGLERIDADVRLRQLLALSLSRSGASDAACTVLTELVREGHRDAETLGLLGRTYKDLALRTSGASRARLLRSAHNAYREGFELANGLHDVPGAIYDGINAAATAALLGQRRRAGLLSKSVDAICAASAADDYWTAVTRAEASLICGDIERAATQYGQAVTATRPSLADVSTSRRQARLLLKSTGHPSDALDASFPVPPVLVVNRGVDLETFSRALSSAPGPQAIVYALAAGPGDAMVIEAAIDAGCEVRIILPSTMSAARRKYRRVHAAAMDNLEGLIARASGVVVANDLTDEPSEIGLRFAELLQQGLAKLRAAALDTDLVMVPDRPPARPALSRKPRRTARLRPGMIREEMVAILFADAVNFSRLTDTEVPMFVEHFVGLIAGLTRSTGVRLLAGNTWGDGFYFVFPAVRDAGRFALALSDRIGRTEWRRKGLPKDLNLRIGLHAGPTFACVDPITLRRNYVGAHVSRAARIEPITPPGTVYASEAFAAIAAATNVSEFACEYAGLRPLAKGYGTLGTYRVHGRRTLRPTPAT